VGGWGSGGAGSGLAVAGLRLKHNRRRQLDEADPPDLQFNFGPGWHFFHGMKNPPGHGFTLLPCLIRPRSLEQVTLCSCAPMAVVDHALRVRGIANLRIAEASIMPFIVNAYTDAPAIISGEKAAAMTLVATWQSRHERNSG
jgi:hypothetical protein